MGEEAQLDWKEELTITLKTGELVTLNVLPQFIRFLDLRYISYP